ncbi:hypothetical protein BOX15_Mlig006826g1, partial [Macrostomum lignano]
GAGLTMSERISSHLEVKAGVLVKRSQNKHLFTRENFKERYFMLMPMSLQYFECSKSSSPSRASKPRGRIFLALMKAVESVDKLDTRFGGGRWRFGLQIVYVEDVHYTHYTLYALAATEADRADWLRLIRDNALARGARFGPVYHPGAWLKPGRFACCNSSDKKSHGCSPATDAQQLQQQDESVQLATQRQQRPANQLQPLSQQQLTSQTGVGNSRSTSNFITDSSANGVTGGGDQPTGAAGNVVVAIHNFRPMRSNQIRLEKGGRYMVVDGSNAKWWYVRDSSGEYGYIPANYIRKPDSLETYDWYYKNISRQRAEHILLDLGRKEGCFLVRDSVSKRNSYTLSVMAKDVNNRSEWRVHHYHIYVNDQRQYYLAEKHACASIPELIFYHKHNSGGLVVRLRSPPSLGQEAPAPVGLGFDELEVDPAELKMDRDPIGRGQFGEVRRGWLRGTPVAVKLMLEGAMAEEDFIEEARNMRNLNHPNLVQLFGVVTKSKPVMLVTDYMPYGSLKDFLRSRRDNYMKASRVAALLDVCNQVAVAMMYLEERNFIHRDLACRNILVKSLLHLHGYIEVKVSDFGMARFLLGQEYDASAGSKFPVRWAAPEVFQCNRYSVKSDVWAFGVLMWEVFTCCDSPYGNRTNAQVCQYVADGGVLEKPRLCPEHQVYVYIMLDCWKSQSSDRPSFSEIVAKFDIVLENTNVFR